MVSLPLINDSCTSNAKSRCFRYAPKPKNISLPTGAVNHELLMPEALSDWKPPGHKQNMSSQAHYLAGTSDSLEGFAKKGGVRRGLRVLDAGG